MIKDSGDRTEFESGAVRDCAEGKGRCDLVPIEAFCEATRSADDILGKRGGCRIRIKISAEIPRLCR